MKDPYAQAVSNETREWAIRVQRRIPLGEIENRQVQTIRPPLSFIDGETHPWFFSSPLSTR